MGTSLAMIDATYGHLAPDAGEREREVLDAFDARSDVLEAELPRLGGFGETTSETGA